MATESFLVTALPYSASPEEPFHVSLFITHRLTPDGPRGVVGDFPNVRKWTSLLAGAKFRLRGGGVGGGVLDIAVAPILDPLVPDLWPRVFPADLEVRPWQVPNYTAGRWTSYAAHRMQAHALAVHAVSIFSSPVDPPTVSGNALTDPLLETLGLHVRQLPLTRAIDGEFDRDVTRRLDSLLDLDPFTGGGISTAAPVSGTTLLAGDVHAARRYYQREEATVPYQERPTDGATGQPIEKPKPDFHERAAMLGDLSPLLRKLGLVIDLKVTDPAALAKVNWIQAEIEIPGLQNPIGSQPRTSCQTVGHVFTAVSATGDYELGMLKIGDEERFTLLDLDPDASALKLEQYVRTLPRLAAADANGDPVNSAPSTLRATGFSVARRNAASLLRQRVDGAAAKDVALLSGKAPPLSLEQITRGIRLEVWDDVSGRWHSLHRRLLTVEVEGGGVVLDREPDTGFLQVGTVSKSSDEPDAPVYAHEVLAGWDGWSLSAPRPGKVVVHENGVENVVDAPAPDPDPVNPVASSTEVAPGTLPRLRYGRHYAFRAYAVDLAGNSRPHSLGGVPEGVSGGGGGAGGVATPAAVEPTKPGPTGVAGRVGDQIRVQPPGARIVEKQAGSGRIAGRAVPPGLTGRVKEGGGGTDRGEADAADLVKLPYAPVVVAPTEIEPLAAQRVGGRVADAARIPAADPKVAVTEELRTRIQSLRPPPVEGPDPSRGATGLEGAWIEATRVEEVDRLITARIASRVEGAGTRGPTRSQRIDLAFREATANVPHLVRRTDLDAGQKAANALAATLAHQPGLQAAIQAGALNIGDLVALVSDLITTPRPFLRWDPVIEPAVVPRHAYTEGESLLRLVIRSGVQQAEPGDLAVTVIPPAEYVAGILAQHPGLGLAWREDSQRHLAPPKTSQFEAELHGEFDSAFGAATPAEAVKAALGIALKESGSFMDTSVADIENPGQRLPQPGVTFHVTPTAELPEVSDPADLPDGDMLSPGQYVAHDVDEVLLPYLPDPLADGVSFTFPDAGKFHRLAGLLAVEGITLRYPGNWPARTPFRLVLESGSELGAMVDGHVIRITLPPGEQLRVRMSSSIARDKLDLLGLWRSMPDVIRDNPLLREAAVDGWFWWLTPATELRLVHAVPKPIEAPRPTILLPLRGAGDTAVVLFGAVDVHGPSTERIDIEASWTQWVDDIAKPGPEQVTTKAVACGTEITPEEDLVILSSADGTVSLPGGQSIRTHAAVHQTGDTLHRRIDYRVRATTRYREYFPPQVVPDIDDISVVGPTRTIDVPSSARPRKVIVRDVLPLFRWEEHTEPDQPFGLRRTRRAGLRIYLERPWFSSGDGELLGVIIAPGVDSLAPGSVSQWAADPVFLQQGPASRSSLPLVDLLHLTGLDDREEAARPVGPPVTLPLVDVEGRPSVWVLGYRPEYSPERKLWFVDVALDPGTAFWPFVQLAVARYQPHSLDGMHLGPVTLCDFAQLAPERSATLSRTDEQHVRVVVTGPVGHPRVPRGSIADKGFLANVDATRKMRARLERFEPSIGTDLGWVAVSQVDLPILGVDGTVVSWAGEIALPEPISPRTPGESTEWRVTLEEWEYLPADTGAGGVGGFQPRIVYADHLPL